MIIIFLTLGLVLGSFGIGVKKYLYQEISDTFEHYAQAVVPVWDGQPDFSDQIIKNYTFQGANIDLLNRNGQMVQSSTGFYKDRSYRIDPSVLSGRTIYKVEKSGQSEERIMAVYTPLLYEEQVVGILRYTTSLKLANSTIERIFSYALITCTAIATITFFVSLHLGNSIVKPLEDIISLTRKMAEGNYREKIKKQYPYEAGELVSILNHMGDEIGKADQLKNDFISSISHELRTPLTGIKGWVETMREPEGLKEEEMEFGLKIIENETERLITMVETLLDFSRYQSGRVTASFQQINMEELVLEAVFQLQKKAKKKDIRLVTRTSSAELYGDGDKLKQVLLNVIDNSIKFSNEHSAIEIVQNKEGEQVEVTVRDFGIGIRADALSYVTRSFYKGDDKFPGEGIGLSICQKIIELHGGLLRIESEYGKGTAVTISLLKNPPFKNP
jgi:signal transduction histidine kinase